MKRSKSPVSDGKKRKQKRQEPPADPETLFKRINHIRKQIGLPEIKTQEVIESYAKSIVNSGEMQNMDTDKSIVISKMNFCESFDGETTASELISTWMNSSNRRPVILAPGEYGTVVFVEKEAITVISVVVASFYR